ncbi:hypothetical protein LY28_03295 [Ruminiclostridium sufflavum DSM 19573]|uniref:Uncharacterized protein n=1 Tax=Ruminiclostridium sufflavum DSM 19573 TaxID=1121337 RepID=A0A318XJM6_9FIRM|nr:hypothetical protein [Ruminiclostridium sufflavum]PYG85607.1 hypothetical protein LY28_03295 [Ruminiclostridium sufflavum DSM 19573]
MAFVNERMTKEEMAEFEAKAIPNPGNNFITLSPSRWTINREGNVFLVKASQNREEPDEYYFVLCWNDIPLAVKLKETWVKGSPRKWELISLHIKENLIEKRFEILQSLKEALTVYGYNGNPDEPFDNINKNTKVEFNF